MRVQQRYIRQMGRVFQGSKDPQEIERIPRLQVNLDVSSRRTFFQEAKDANLGDAAFQEELARVMGSESDSLLQHPTGLPSGRSLPWRSGGRSAGAGGRGPAGERG